MACAVCINACLDLHIINNVIETVTVLEAVLKGLIDVAELVAQEIVDHQVYTHLTITYSTLTNVDCSVNR